MHRRPARCRAVAARSCSTASAWASAASRSRDLLDPAGRRARRRRGAADRGVLGGQLHLPPKAKRVIYLFMAGGPSQLELFDYKPLLNERNGEQLPDSVRRGQRLTGMSGNQASLPLAGSQFKFAQHGQVGRVGQRTAAAHRARSSTTSASSARCTPRRSTTTRRSRSSRPARRSRAGPSMGAWLQLRPGQREREPAGVRRADHARARSTSRSTRACGAAASCRRSIRACSSAAARTRCCTSANPDGVDAREPPAACSTGCASCTRMQPSELGDAGDRRAHRAVRDGLPHADQRARSDGPVERDRRDVRAVRPGRANARHVRRQLPARPPAGRARRAVHPALSPGLGPARQPAAATSDASARRPIRPRAALVIDLKQRGLLDDTLVVWGGEFGRTNYSQGKLTADQLRPRSSSALLHDVDGRRRRQAGARLRRDRRLRLQHRRRTASTSTTSTPRSCTCSASTTSG